MILKPDSLIFDLDGTLWDAVDTYVYSWNEGARIEKLNRVFTRADLHFVMGWERAKVLSYFFPEMQVDEREKIYKTINDCRIKLMPKLGGLLYNGVRDGIIKLSEKYKLFIVSNCPENMILEFLKWADLEKYITDEMAHGVNSMPKHFNINLLVEKHNLKEALYIGDTLGDGLETRMAGLPFVFLSYGFGTTDDYDLKFDDFNSFTEYFLDL